MSKNIGFTKKEAEELVNDIPDVYGDGDIEAYAQKEEHFHHGCGECHPDGGKYEYIVVLRKRRDK